MYICVRVLHERWTQLSHTHVPATAEASNEASTPHYSHIYTVYVTVYEPRQHVARDATDIQRSTDARSRPSLPWKRNEYYVFRVCSFSYQACEAHAPHYIVTCGPSGCTLLFCHITSPMARLSKKVIGRKMSVLILLQRMSNFKKNSVKYYHKCWHTSPCKVTAILLRF